MKVKYDQASNDRALEAIVRISNFFCGPEDLLTSDADRLQCAIRRLTEFTEYVAMTAEEIDKRDVYYERIVSAIERIADVLEVDLNDGE
jgi:hypothetical protein